MELPGACSIRKGPVQAQLVLVFSMCTCYPPLMTYHICESESPSSLDRSNKSLAFSPDIVDSVSPTACLNRVSNLAWSAAVMKLSRIFGILFDFGAGALLATGATVPPVRNDAAIWLKPVAWGFIGAGGGAGAACCCC